MSKESSSGGVGFLGLLQIVFITLKLCGVIQWSWILVLMPIWLPLFVAIFLIALAVVFK